MTDVYARNVSAQPASPWRPRPNLPFNPYVVAAAVCLAAVNAGIGLAMGEGRSKLGWLVALLPLLVVGSWLAITHRNAIAYAPFVWAFLSLPAGHSFHAGAAVIYPADLMVALALAGWVATKLASPSDRATWRRSLVLSWPFGLFAIAVLAGVFRGHQRWGVSYLSEPTRLLAYSMIGAALAGVAPKTAFRAFTAVFYTGAAYQAVLGVYYLGTGRSQTPLTAAVSTGGTRALSLGTAVYLTGSLVLALLHLELDREGRRPLLHLTIAGLALFGIVISLGRTTFAAVAVLVPLLLFGLRRMRRVLLSWLPLILPVAVFLATAMLLLHPSLASSLTGRLTGKLSNDAALVQRRHEVHATLHGIGSSPLLGFGFGRPVQWVGVDGSQHTSTGDPENSYAWILAGGGALAIAALAVLMLAFYGDAWRRLRDAEHEARALVVFSMSMVFVLLVNAFTGPIFSDPTFALSLWVALLLPATVVRSALKSAG